MLISTKTGRSYQPPSSLLADGTFEHTKSNRVNMRHEATKETVTCGIKELRPDQIYLLKSLNVTCQVKLKEERMKTQDVMSKVCFFHLKPNCV